MKTSSARKITKNILLALIIILAVIAIVIAIKGGEGWRHTWDYMWTRINFLILVTLIFWFLGPLALKMLDGRIKHIVDDIDDLEKEKANIADEIKEIEDNLAHSVERFEQIRTRLQQEIALKREQIVQSAKEEAAAILEQAQVQCQSILDDTKKGLKGELVDMAVNKALAQLPEIITAQDHKRLFESFYAKAFNALKPA